MIKKYKDFKVFYLYSKENKRSYYQNNFLLPFYQRLQSLCDTSWRQNKEIVSVSVLSDYLEKGPECKLACLQDTSSATGGLEGVANGSRGWKRLVDTRVRIYILPLSVFAQRKRSNARTHDRSRGRRPILKPVLRGSARYFVSQDQRISLSRQFVCIILVCTYIAAR